MALALVIGVCSSDSLVKTTRDANSVWLLNNHQTMGLGEFVAKVKAATGGELKIIVNSGGALGYKGPELLNFEEARILNDTPVRDQFPEQR